jgi:hypothetical protein
MAGLGLFSLAPEYPRLDAVPPFAGPISGLPDLSGGMPPFPGPASILTTDGIHDEGDSRETITQHIALQTFRDPESDLAVHTGINHLAFMKDGALQASASRYRYSDLHPQYVPRTVSSLNYYLTTADGRAEFGITRDAQDILDVWRFVGVQQTAVPSILRSIEDHVCTYAVGKRVRTFDIWRVNEANIKTGDTAWLILRRYPWVLEPLTSDEKKVERKTKAKSSSASSSSTSSSSDWLQEYISRERKEHEEKEEKEREKKKTAPTGLPSIIPSVDRWTTKVTAAPSSATTTTPVEYYWQFEPYVTHGNESVPYELYHSDDYIGATIRVGHITGFFGTRDSLPRSRTKIKKMLYPTDATDAYKSVCPDLPEIEIMLRVKG